jgi:mono/diheme cytochrome c family protein
MLKRVVAVVEVVALAGFVVFVVLLLVAQPESKETAATTDGKAAVVDGEAIYDSACASCHGGKGQGAVGPKLNGGAVTREFRDADAELIVVRDGRSGMPSFEGRLSPEQLQAVVEFTRTGLQQR